MNSAHDTHSDELLCERVAAVDQLRGLAVLILIVTSIGPRAIFALPPSPVTQMLCVQLRPAIWQGLTLTNLCWPLFLFVSGMSLALSLDRRKRAGERVARSASHHLQRGAMLLFIGFLLTGGFSVAWPLVIWAGPLQQLGVCLLLGVVIATVCTRWQSRLATGLLLIVVTGGLLAGYPLLNDELGRYGVNNNVAAFLDQWLLPGRTHFAVWDPHGVFTTLPALGLLGLGLAVGTALGKNRSNLRSVIGASLIIALVCVNGGWLMHPIQPCIPALMTPAFVLVATGICLLALVAGLALEASSSGRRIALPLEMLGRNSLLLVILLSLHSLTAVSDVLVGGDVGQFLRGFAPHCRFAVELTAMWVMAWVLFRRNVFFTL